MIWQQLKLPNASNPELMGLYINAKNTWLEDSKTLADYRGLQFLVTASGTLNLWQL